MVDLIKIVIIMPITMLHITYSFFYKLSSMTIRNNPK